MVREGWKVKGKVGFDKVCEGKADEVGLNVKWVFIRFGKASGFADKMPAGT